MSNAVIIYEHINFQGKAFSLVPGTYDFAQISASLGNDQLSSVKVPSGWKVTLYEHAGFTGRSVTLERDAPTLTSFNDKTSSIIVEGGRGLLRHGSRGQDVEELQNALIEYGYELEADGIFGQGTANAVRGFQRDNGLTADGIVGLKTWTALGR